MNVPATPVVPTRIVGRSRRMVPTRSGRPGRPGRARAPPARASSRRGRRGRRGRARACRRARSPRAIVGLGSPGLEHRQAEQPGDADPGRARADQHDPRVGERPRRSPAAPASTPATTTAAVPWMSSLNDGTRSRVAVEEAQRVVLLEVLELDDAAGPDRLDPGDERLDERVVLGAAQARRAIAEVQRVGEQRRVVRARRRARPAASGPGGCRRPRCTARACRSGWPCRRRPGRRGRGSARCR